MEKQLNLWISEMTTNKKSVVDSFVMRLQAKEITVMLPRVKKISNLFQLVQAGLQVSKGDRYHMEKC